MNIIETEDKKKMYTGILIGLAINANFIINFVSTIVHISNMYVYFLLILGIISVIINGYKLKKDNKIFIIIFCFIMQFAIGFLKINSETTKHFFLCFLGIAIPCLMMTANEFDVNFILKSIILSSFVCGMFYFKIYITHFDVYNATLQMGIAYSLLPGLTTACIILMDIKNQTKRYKLLGLCIFILSILALFRLMTRGAYMCVLVFVISLILIKQQNNIPKKVFTIISLVLVSIIIVFIFQENFAKSDWYNKVFGIKQDNILNGREQDYDILFKWRGMDNFLLGNGIGSYKINVGSDYFHNLFGQIFYEQGIFFTLLIAVIVYNQFKKIKRKSKLESKEKEFILMLLCISILRLQVSYYYWIDASFWIFLWINFIYKK